VEQKDPSELVGLFTDGEIKSPYPYWTVNPNQITQSDGRAGWLAGAV
jgi:hypothetical protein